MRNPQIACRLQRPLGCRVAVARWLERLGEDLVVRCKAFADIELTRREIATQHSNAEFGGTRLECEAFGRLEQRPADAVPARAGADYKFGDQRVMARRFVERLERDTREKHDEADDRISVLRDEDGAGILSTPQVHVSEIFVRHGVARAETRIKPPFCVLQLDNTGPTCVAVAVLELANRKSSIIAHKDNSVGRKAASGVDHRGDLHNLALPHESVDHSVAADDQLAYIRAVEFWRTRSRASRARTRVGRLTPEVEL